MKSNYTRVLRLSWLLLILVTTQQITAQDIKTPAQSAFRVPLDYVTISPVFNQQNIQATQDSGDISYQSLEKFPRWRALRRTRLISLPVKQWVPFKDTTLDGDSGFFKEKIVRVSGRLVTATDHGVWIYQHHKKRVAYVPYTVTERIKSGSSTGRTIYLAWIPVLAEIAGWVAVDEINGTDKDRGLIFASVVFLTGAVDFGLWIDYMEKKRHTPLCSMWMNGSETKGQTFKHYAEGGRFRDAPGVVDVLLSNDIGIFPRTYVRRTSVDPSLFLDTDHSPTRQP